MYDQFSYWLDDPDGSAKNERNVAVFRFAHSLLKRALSDSFTNAVPPPPAPGFPSSGAAGSGAAGSGIGAAGAGASGRKSRQQRSWSLVDHLGDERLALQVAKEIVERAEPETIAEAVPQVGAGAGAETGNRKKMAAQLVSIVLQQTLADVELELQVQAPASASSIRPEVAPLPAEANNNNQLLSIVNRHLDLGKSQATSAIPFPSAFQVQIFISSLSVFVYK